MIKYSLLMIALLFAGLSFAQEFEFGTKMHKFGKVKEGEVLRFEYRFTNTGDQPLVITDIKVTCGCTKPEWPKTPVNPGDTAVIKVSFDTKGKIGYQSRTLDIISNAKKSPYTLKFKCIVEN